MRGDVQCIAFALMSFGMEILNHSFFNYLCKGVYSHKINEYFRLETNLNNTYFSKAALKYDRGKCD